MFSKKFLLFFVVFLLITASIAFTLIQTARKNTQQYVQPQPEITALSPTPLLPTPCVCPFVLKPICGTDYISYKNECDARCVGVGVSYSGKCREFDRTKPLPPDCQPCTIECPNDQTFFEDEKGCPICKCRFQETEEGD